MPLNCCQKAAFFCGQNPNYLWDLAFLSLDESVVSECGENLPNRRPRFQVHDAPSARSRNGCFARTDNLLSGNQDTGSAQRAKLPGAASERRPSSV